jgi:UDP-N-acetylglucosamine 2-epimerase (non-hydrolysing)
VPVLLLRDVTGRPEAFHAGTVRLVGTGQRHSVEETERSLCDAQTFAGVARSDNPFGDGQATRVSGRADKSV